MVVGIEGTRDKKSMGRLKTTELKKVKSVIVKENNITVLREQKKTWDGVRTLQLG